jgi:GAF domain-containing protein
MFASLNLGMGLVIAGLVFVILVWGLLRLLPRSQASGQIEISPLTPQNLNQSTDAVLVIQPGGRVDYVNARARELFGLHESDPADLERLMRRIRPPEDFLDVCSAPGQKRVSVNGKLVDITSYQVPGRYAQLLVSLRSIDLMPALNGGGAASSVLTTITDFSRAVASSLDFETVIRLILDNIIRIVPGDLLEMKVWDATANAFISYRFQDADGAGRKLVRSAQSQFGNLADKAIEARSPLLITDTRLVSGTEAGGTFIPVQSFIAVPLLVDDELVGLFEAGQTVSAAFSQSDLDLLNLIAGQAAVALRNAILFEQEQRHAVELSGLANLAHAVSAIQDPKDLFARLVESVAPLFKADIVGFLLYDENKRTLEAQVPFHGLPPHIVQIYRALFSGSSPANALLASRQPIITPDAAQDENWRVLGLTDIAQAASLRDSALIPLLSMGHMVGYFQVSRHSDGTTAFSESEIHLMGIVSDQAAAIIDSSMLIQQNRSRAQRSDALRRIASLSSSSATLEEVLRFSMQELVGLFQASSGAIFLLDEARGELAPDPNSLVGVMEEKVSVFHPIFVDDPEYRLTVSGSQRPFLSGRLSVDRRVLTFYRPLVTGLGLESAIVVPLVSREKTLGELMLGSDKIEFFNNYDLQVISTAAGQLASAIESLHLLSQTDETLRHRVERLTSIARISREMAASLDLDHLLYVIHDETVRAISADCGSVLYLDPEAGANDLKVFRSVGCPYTGELSPLERSAIDKGQLVQIDDFGQGGFFPPHDGVRSALVIPISHHGKVSGLLQLHSSQTSFFTSEAVETAQTLAIQAGIALNNVTQYQSERQNAESLRRRSDSFAKFLNTSYAINSDLSLDESLRVIAQGIRDASGFQVVLISIYEQDSGMLRRVTGVGLPQNTLNELMARKQPYSGVQTLMKPEFKISRSYFIAGDQTPVLPADVHVVTLESDSARPAQNAWDPEDSFIIPLLNSNGDPLGLISLDSPANGLRPDLAAIDALEVFAAQAVLIIENTTRIGDLRSRIDSLSSGLQRQQKLLSVTQNDLPILLRKDLEQTISLHNLDRRAQRVRAGLAITESVSRQLDSSSALLALGRETLTQLGMAIALVAENPPEGPRLLHVMGSVPRSSNPEALFGQRNPLRAVLQNGEPILIPNLDDNDEWRDTPLLTQMRAKGVICLPVMVENHVVAAMLALSHEPMPAFTEEDSQVYYQISRQTSVVLQNISLLNETRRRLQEVNLLLDFSRRLGGLDPENIVKALLDSGRRVLQSAHAGVVLLWNDQSKLLEPRAIFGYADNTSMLRITYHMGEALPGNVFMDKKPRRVDEVNFARDYALAPENLGVYRQATGGRLPVSSLLVPIIAGEQAIGLLVLDNFNTPAAFKPEDEALMVSLSQQVALSLENVRLVHATAERAGQLQALNDVATSMTSSLHFDELIASLLDQLQPVLPFDTATLWLRNDDRLIVSAARGFPDTEKRLGLAVSVADSALFKEMIRSGQPIFVPDVREDARFLVVEAPRLSWLGIPLVSKSQLIGVIALEKWQSHFYSSEQIQLATTFAGQAAVALDNATLYEDSLRRAAELDERSQRLALLNRFSSSLSGLLDANQILNLSAQELQEALNVKRVSVVSFEHGSALWVAASPRVRAKLPQVLPDAPLFARLNESLGVFNTDNVQTESDLAPLMDFLGDDTKALLVLPLISGQNLRALLFVQMSGDNRFTVTEIELARTIANQAAIALENARLYQSTVRTADRFAILHQASAEIGASLDPEAIYSSIHKSVERLMPVEAFVISLLDEEKQEVEGVYLMDKGVRTPNVRMPLGQGLSSRVIQSGEPLFIDNSENADSMGAVAIGEHGTPVSILAVPLVLGNKILGMLSAQSYQSNVYSEDDLQILSTLANQAVVAIQNGRLFGETQRLAQELEQRVIERTAQLQREQQGTETLLRILTEVSSSLDLDRALNRTLSLLNEAIGAEQGTIMLLNVEDSLLHYRAGYGYLSERADESERGFTLKVGEGLAGWVVQNREAVLVDDLREDPRWVQSASTSREHRSSIVVPLLVADDVIGVLMVFRREDHFFTHENLNLVKAIASQVAVAINNAHLYELIRDQAERLGLMLRKEQEEASRSQAILEAVADGVLVTGSDNRITFLNSSIQRILGIDVDHYLQEPLEGFGGMFGKAASTWMETIQRWSEAPGSYETGDMYAEQLELGDGRIALVHLAPVILQNDFLGTVSIFRDITHEVEVDRLKSEFVATVSHELRTPMTAIKGYVDILLLGAAGAINENQAHFLEVVKNNIDRLNILVNDLLDISRIEAGRVILSPQPLDLRDIAEDVIADVLRRSQEENKPMALSLDAPRSLPRVYGDAERVRQVIDNLVDNAYHYTPENGTIKVHIRAVNQDEVQVDVIDNGVGIAPADQERIFERFYRGEHPLVLATPGTGLGLPIVKQLVEMHNGKIWMASDGIPGQGSTFSFVLPVYKDK